MCAKGRDAPVSTSTSVMSELGHASATGRVVCAKAIVFPSGDQSIASPPRPLSGMPPTDRLVAMSCRASRAPPASGGTLMTQRRPGRSSWPTTRASSLSRSRRSLSSGAGSAAMKASFLPSGDQACCETSDFVRRQPPRLAARGGKQPDVGVPFAALGDERDPLSVGRPARTAGGLIGERDLAGVLAVGRGEPDLRAVLALVALHDRLAHDEGDALAVRRNLDVGDGPVLRHFLGRPLVGSRVRGEGGRGRGREQGDAEGESAHGGPPVARILRPPGTGPDGAGSQSVEGMGCLSERRPPWSPARCPRSVERPSPRSADLADDRPVEVPRGGRAFESSAFAPRPEGGLPDGAAHRRRVRGGRLRAPAAPVHDRAAPPGAAEREVRAAPWRLPRLVLSEKERRACPQRLAVGARGRWRVPSAAALAPGAAVAAYSHPRLRNRPPRP